MTVTKADVGKQVRYWDNGWHFALLVKLGRRWALVLHPVTGRKSKKTGLRLPYRLPRATVESTGGV